jgi:hypothetical protein
MIPNYWIILLFIVIFSIICFVLSYNNWKKNKVNKENERKTLYPVRIPKKQIKIKRIIKETEAEEKREEEKIIAKKMPPEIIKLNDLVTDFIDNANEDNGKWDCLIAVGDIYRKGAFPRFLPNEYLAIEIFKVAAMCPDGNISGLAQVKYIEARTDPINDEDKKGEHFPTEYGVQICEVATQRIKYLPSHAFEKPKMQKPSVVKRTERVPAYGGQVGHMGGDDYNYMRLFENTDDNYDFNPDIGDLNNFDINNLFRPDNVRPVTNTIYKADSQNVHDHSVVSIAKKNLEEISRENNSRDSPQKTIEQIRQFILENEELTDKQASDALLVIDKLGTSKNSSFEKSEQEILVDVWNKISNEKDTTLKNNLSETLGKQLASAVEHGNIVCSTGKVIRILSVFDGVEDDKLESVKPLWAIREEISNLASKTRDDHLNGLNDMQKLAYDRNELPELDKKMKDEFRENAKKIYIDELKMSDKIVNPIISMYEDAF